MHNKIFFILLSLGLQIFSSNGFAMLLDLDTGKTLFAEKDHGQYCVFEKGADGAVRAVTTNAVDKSKLRNAMSMWPRHLTLYTIPFGFFWGPFFSLSSSDQILPKLISYESVGGALAVISVFELAERIGKEKRLNKLSSGLCTEVSGNYYLRVLHGLYSLDSDPSIKSNSMCVPPVGLGEGLGAWLPVNP